MAWFLFASGKATSMSLSFTLILASLYDGTLCLGVSQGEWKRPKMTQWMVMGSEVRNECQCIELTLWVFQNMPEIHTLCLFLLPMSSIVTVNIQPSPRTLPRSTTTQRGDSVSQDQNQQLQSMTAA